MCGTKTTNFIFIGDASGQPDKVLFRREDDDRIYQLVNLMLKKFGDMTGFQCISPGPMFINDRVQ